MIIHADARSLPLADECVQLCITSPPYWALRSYGIGTENGEIGLERSIREYIDTLVAVFEEVKRVLHPTGICLINIGDSYSSGERGSYDPARVSRTSGLANNSAGGKRPSAKENGLKPKDLCLIPERLAIALQEAGWYVRSRIAWVKCLSGGTWLYVKSQKGEMPMTVKDAARLTPGSVSLWNGERWTKALSFQRQPRKGHEIELVLRSGERISCSPDHRWPTKRGLLAASELVIGDALRMCRLPEPTGPIKAEWMDKEIAWFLGIYLAEGSKMAGTKNYGFCVAAHADELPWVERIRAITNKCGGSVTFAVYGNKLTIRVYGRVLTAIVDDHIGGKDAHDKGLKVRCWSYPNEWLKALLDGYCEGDGHWRADTGQWNLGFTRNYNLERDLRTISARLGMALVLRLSVATSQWGEFPSFRGSIRQRNGHFSERPRGEIVEIRKARCRETWDIAVEDEPHLFALASGVLTHNSAPMPESVSDRPTSAWEHVLLLTKNARYFWDAEAVREVPSQSTFERWGDRAFTKHRPDGQPTYAFVPGGNSCGVNPNGRNLRNWWNIGPDPSSEAYCVACDLMYDRSPHGQVCVRCKGKLTAHYAAFPRELVRKCVLAGTPERGVCSACGTPWVRVVETTFRPIGANSKSGNKIQASHPRTIEDMERGRDSVSLYQPQNMKYGRAHKDVSTLGWRPQCQCDWHCRECGHSVPYLYATQRPGSQARLSSSVGADTISEQPDSSRKSPSKASATSRDLSALRKDLHGSQKREVLQSELLLDLDARQQQSRSIREGRALDELQGRSPYLENGIRHDLHAEPSEGLATGICDGTYDHSREDVGTIASTGGKGSPHKRNQDRQSTGKSSRRDRGAALIDSSSDGEMPELRDGVSTSSAQECPYCHRRETLEPPPTKPALVLDCFGGTNTTGIVAQSLGRRWAITELSWEYCKYSQRRSSQRGLFA